MPTADINGIKMNYEIAGAGQPVVLITGFSGDIAFWNGLVPHLSEKYMVITMDNRGVGKTEYKGSFIMKDLADDVIALLDHLSIYKAHILGWSMGSNIAHDIAVRYPGRVISLTLVSAYMKRPARSSFIMNAAIDAVIKGTDWDVFLSIMQTMSFPETVFSKREEKGIKFKQQTNFTIGGLKDQMAALDGHDGTLTASKITAPTLEIHGTSDIMVPPEMGYEYASKIANCKIYRVPGAGHIVNPNTYFQRFLDHLDENSRS